MQNYSAQNMAAAVTPPILEETFNPKKKKEKENIFRTFLVPDIQVEVLNQQWPAHQPLVGVLHLRSVYTTTGNGLEPVTVIYALVLLL